MKENKYNPLGKYLPFLTCLLLVLCIVFGSMLIVRDRADKRDEALYMNHLYAEVNDCLYMVDDALGENISQIERESLMLETRHALRNVAEELENRYYFVSESIPSVVSSWFYERASEITNQR